MMKGWVYSVPVSTTGLIKPSVPITHDFDVILPNHCR